MIKRIERNGISICRDCKLKYKVPDGWSSRRCPACLNKAHNAQRKAKGWYKSDRSAWTNRVRKTQGKLPWNRLAIWELHIERMPSWQIAIYYQTSVAAVNRTINRIRIERRNERR